MIRHALAGLSLICAAPALAADAVKPVEIPPGQTAVTLHGAIKGWQGVDYRIEAAKGQTLRLRFKPGKSSCYFNLYAPGAAEAVHVGSTSGDDFGPAATEGGVYRATVYLMRNAARRNETCRYSLAVERTGVSAEAAAEICRANAAALSGVAPEAITLGERIATDDGASIDAKADKGFGVKDLRCLFRPDGGFDHILALTPDEAPRQPWKHPGHKR